MAMIHLLKNLDLIKKGMREFVNSKLPTEESYPNEDSCIFVAMNKNNHPVGWNLFYSGIESLAKSEGHTIVKVPMWHNNMNSIPVATSGETLFVYEPKTRHEVKKQLKRGSK